MSTSAIVSGQGMPAYPGLPEPKFHVFLAHDEPAKQTHYAPGVTFQIAAYEFGGNTGTYVDSPFHRHPNGADLAALPLKKLVDLPGLLISAAEDGLIDEKGFPWRSRRSHTEQSRADPNGLGEALGGATIISGQVRF